MGEKKLSTNDFAKKIVGIREHPNGVIFDQPFELGYHCPVCKYEQTNGGNFDERLHWSEYNSFIWCSVCNKDFPSALCQPDIDKAIETYLKSVSDAKRLPVTEKEKIEGEINKYADYIEKYRADKTMTSYRMADDLLKLSKHTIQSTDLPSEKIIKYISAYKELYNASGNDEQIKIMSLALCENIENLLKHPVLSKWISVAERLPEMKGYYLSCVDELIASKRVGIIEIQECYESVSEQKVVLKFQDYVTHWMPLPEKPKK